MNILPDSLARILDHAIFDQIPSCMACFDQDFHLCWFNRPVADLMAKYFDRSPQEMIGVNYFDYVPRARESLEKWLVQARDNSETCQMDGLEIRFSPGGQEVSTFWDIRISPLKADDGGPTYLIMLAQNVTASKQAERASEADRQRLQALFDHAMDAIVIFNEHEQVLDVNPAACQLFGLEREEFRFRRVADSLPRMDQSDLSAWWQTFRANRQHEGSFATRNHHGEYHHVEYRAVADLQPGVHLIIFRDVTRREQAREQLRKTEELLRNILDHAPMPIFVVTPDQHFRLVNRAWDQLLGPYQPGMAITDLADRVSTEALQQLMAINDQVVETGEPVQCEEQIDYQGEPLTFYTSKFPLRDAAGRVDAVGGISIDISNWRSTERVLLENETKFRKLVERSNDGIILSDEDGRIIEWNAAEEQITGMPASEAIGQFIWDIQYALAPAHLQTPDFFASLKDRLLQMIHTGESAWLSGLWETDLCQRNGSLIRVQSSIFLIRTQHGSMVGSITREVTRERKIQEEINQRNKELTSLLRISQQISGQLDLERMLYSVTDAIVRTLPGAEYAAIWLYDEDRSSLVSRSCSGQDGVRMEEGAVASGNLVTQIFHSDRPVTLVDVDPISAGLPPLPQREKVRALLGVPLVLEGRPVGVMAVSNTRDPAAFSEQDSTWLQSLAGQVVVMAANARLFEQVSSGQTRLQDLSRRLVEVQEEERRKIARELHDEVGQILTGLKLLLRMAAHGSKDMEQNLAEAQNLTNDLLNRVHDMSLDLRPAMLDDLGLLPALLWQFERFRHQTGLEVNFRHHGLEGVRFPVELETAVYRIAQEALTNVARHAGVETVALWAWANERELGLQVEDHGVGFDLEEVVSARGSIGLNGIRERAALLGGHMTLRTTRGKGTRIRAVFPITPDGQEREQEL